jgi:hypothetical protein
MIPYTYLLKHIPTNTFYYGCRYAKGCHPTEFWDDYKTSSKYVKQLIEKYGVNSFVFEIRQTFTDVKKARLWETRVLKRMNAANRNDFINKTDNISISPEDAQKGRTNRVPSDKLLAHAKRMGLSNTGRVHSDEVNEKKAHWGNTYKLGVKESEETKRKKSLSKLGKPSNAVGNYQPKCSCILCHRELTTIVLKQHSSRHHLI